MWWYGATAINSFCDDSTYLGVYLIWIIKNGAVLFVLSDTIAEFTEIRGKKEAR